MTNDSTNLRVDPDQPEQIPFKCADFYLDEDRYENPKEVFKFVKGLIDATGLPQRGPLSVLDVGCATGELIYYLKTQYPQFAFLGLDHDQLLLDKAQAMGFLNDESWVKGDAEAFNLDRKFDIITCMGVLGLFEDVRICLRNLIKHAQPGGTILIQAPINDDPFDVRIQYRENYPENTAWTVNGWNINARQSIAHFLNTEAADEVSSFDFLPFEMPIDLEKREEQPVRSWTIKTAEGSRILVNGICLVIKDTVLKIDIKPQSER